MTLIYRLQALGELCKRYGDALRYAWTHRKAMDPIPRPAYEAQFLPAALALQDTPVTPAPRLASWCMIGFAVIALLWAALGHIDVVATATGRIVPNDGTKIIQCVETATVRAIHVRDGQVVRAGDRLIELDATNALADSDRLRADLVSARLQMARGKAMLSAIDSDSAPVLDASAGILETQRIEAQALVNGQYNEVRAKLSRLDAQFARHEAEHQSLLQLVRKLEQTVPIARRRAQDFKNLFEQRFVSEHGYLEREQARIEQEADLAVQRGRIQEVAAAVNETRSQRRSLIAEARRINLDSINEGRQKAATWEQELKKADSRGRFLRLTAPVDGTVQQLAMHTVGGVVTSAQPLMQIVPRDHPLEIEALIENKDIGFVNAGQNAEVKVETFQFTKYGTLHAKVISVSHDAINDEKRGLVYSARAKMDRSSIDVDGTQVKLSPGMVVTVEVKIARRRVIEYFLSPLMQYGHEALRER